MKIKDYLDEMRDAIEDRKANEKPRFHDARSISPNQLRASLDRISSSQCFILDAQTDEHGRHTLLLSEDVMHTDMSKALQLKEPKD